jgi:signal transduction histidine kinase
MRSIALKLTLAFLFVGVMGAVLMAFFVGQRTQEEFRRFVLDRDRFSFADTLTDYYQTSGSWNGIEDVFGRDPSATHGTGHYGAPQRWKPLHRGSVTLADTDGKVVFCDNPDRVGARVSPRELQHGTPIRVNDNVVGWLLVDRFPGRPEPGSPEANFLARLTRAITYSAVGATAVALVLGVLLTRTFTRPIRELTDATRAVAKGDLGHQVTVRTQDELGELAASFNQMSADLARASELRRQMTADIAHELRTPLSVILGYTEALSDGKLHATPATFDVMHEMAQHLSRLVDDLRTLTLADAGELPLTRRLVDPEALLNRAAAAYKAQAEQKGISLHVEVPPKLPEIEVDPDRLVQVLGNLLSNALRYTPAGGRVSIQSAVNSEQSAVNSDRMGEKLFTDHCLLITVTDTGAGIAPEDLPHIFDRFYRGEKSRHHKEGESGLGLAIAKSLVEMHGGTITVESTLGEGTTFTITLPVTS